MIRAITLAAWFALLTLVAGCNGRTQKQSSSPPPAGTPTTRTISVATATSQPHATSPASQPDYTVIGIIATQLGVERARVTRKAALADLGADESDLGEIVVQLQDEFDITIPDKDQDSFRTVGQIIDCVKTCLPRRQTDPDSAPDQGAPVR